MIRTVSGQAVVPPLSVSGVDSKDYCEGMYERRIRRLVGYYREQACTIIVVGEYKRYINVLYGFVTVNEYKNRPRHENTGKKSERRHSR